jgi:hypothetical protein
MKYRDKSRLYKAQTGATMQSLKKNYTSHHHVTQRDQKAIVSLRDAINRALARQQKAAREKN